MSEPYHHGDLRVALIEAAIAALKTETMDTLSLRKLAKSIGVSHNAPYMHFKNKEALWQAVADHGFVLLGQFIERQMASVEPWRERLITGCQAYVTFALTCPAIMQVMFRPATEGQSRMTSDAGAIAFRVLTAEIAAAQKQGQIRPGPVDRYAVLLWSLMHGIAEIARQTGPISAAFPERTPEERTAWMVEQLISGLAIGSAPDE